MLFWRIVLKKKIGIFACFHRVLAHCDFTGLLLSYVVSKHTVLHSAIKWVIDRLPSTDISPKPCISKSARYLVFSNIDLYFLESPAHGDYQEMYHHGPNAWSQCTAYYSLMNLEKAASWEASLKRDNNVAVLIPSSKRFLPPIYNLSGIQRAFSCNEVFGGAHCYSYRHVVKW